MNESTTARPDADARNLVLVWAGLVALTLASWWFRDHGLGAATAITVILAITFIKVFMVGHSFMEIGRAPWVLRSVFAAWCVGVCATLVMLAFAF